MKWLPILLMNVVTAAGAVLVYDQVRGERAEAPVEVAVGSERALVRRIEALEAVEPLPILQASGTDRRVLDRLEALEDRLAAGSDDEDVPVDGGESANPTPRADEPVAARSPADEPTPEDIRRFRRLREAAQQQDRLAKNRARIRKALGGLGLNLSDRQQQQIEEAHATFEPRIQKFWAEARSQAQATVAAGGTIDRQTIVAETTTAIQLAFAETLSDVVPTADAEAISRAVLTHGK